MKLNLGKNKEAIVNAGTGTLEARKVSKVAPSGLYTTVVIGDVFLRKNNNTGSISLTVRMQDEETSQNIEVTQVIQTSKEKGGSVIITTKGGKSFFTEGYQLLNTISQLTIGEEAKDLDSTKTKIKDVYDFDKKVNTALMLEAYPELKGCKVQIAVIKVMEDQLKDPSYYNEFNKIMLVGNEDGFTLAEIGKSAETPEELTAWSDALEKDFVLDKRKESKKTAKAVEEKAKDIDDNF